MLVAYICHGGGLRWGWLSSRLSDGAVFCAVAGDGLFPIRMILGINERAY